MPRTRPLHAAAPGMSASALEDGVVYHTYSAYEGGLDVLWGMYQWLDRAPPGRNETGFRNAATTSKQRVTRVRKGAATDLVVEQLESTVLYLAHREHFDPLNRAGGDKAATRAPEIGRDVDPRREARIPSHAGEFPNRRDRPRRLEPTSNLRAEVRLLPGPWRPRPLSMPDFERASGPAVVDGYRRGQPTGQRGSGNGPGDMVSASGGSNVVRGDDRAASVFDPGGTEGARQVAVAPWTLAASRLYYVRCDRAREVRGVHQGQRPPQAAKRGRSASSPPRPHPLAALMALESRVRSADPWPPLRGTGVRM